MTISFAMNGFGSLDDDRSKRCQASSLCNGKFEDDFGMGLWEDLNSTKLKQIIEGWTLIQQMNQNQ